MSDETQLTCRLCGQDHRVVPLAPGEKALCVRCDTVLATGTRFGPDGVFVFSVTGLVLALPATLLPFVGAGKLGDERVSFLFTGVRALSEGGMRAIALLVLLCGGLIPVAILAMLAALHAPARLGWACPSSWVLYRWVRVLEHWAIPEVQVLAVLVALSKLGSLVDVTIEAGFWFYCAMSLALLFALHGFDYERLIRKPDMAGRKAVAQP